MVVVAAALVETAALRLVADREVQGLTVAVSVSAVLLRLREQVQEAVRRPAMVHFLLAVLQAAVLAVAEEVGAEVLLVEPVAQVAQGGIRDIRIRWPAGHRLMSVPKQVKLALPVAIL